MLSIIVEIKEKKKLIVNHMNDLSNYPKDQKHSAIILIKKIQKLSAIILIKIIKKLNRLNRIKKLSNMKNNKIKVFNIVINRVKDRVEV